MSKPAVESCQRCLYSTSHPLGLVLDEKGICSGCRVHEEKDSLDWDERWDRLERLVKPYRSRNNRNYDCIVPVTGAGDSFFIVHLVKERLKLNPLLVTYNRYYNTPLGIRNLAQLRRHFNCDILIQNVNPRSVKKISRTTLRLLGSFHWPALAGQSVFPVQTAVTHGIPLILWGAHQGVEQVGMFSHLHEVEMTRRYRKDHDLMGFEADDLLSLFDTLAEEDIWQYRYPDEAELGKVGVRGIYLGNYVRWDPLAQHLQMVKTAKYHSAQMSRTFDVYDHVDDWHYMGMHDCIKQKKHGFGRVLDQACREIRHQRICRDEAIGLVQKYQSQSSNADNLLLEWLNIDRRSLEFIITHHTRESPEPSLSQAPKRVNVQAFLNDFVPNDRLELSGEKRHVVIGKGYPD